MEEVYIFYDDKYLSWFHIHHPESIHPHLASKGECAYSFFSSSAGCHLTTSISSISSFSDILIVSKARLSQTGKKIVNMKAYMIIDDGDYQRCRCSKKLQRKGLLKVKSEELEKHLLMCITCTTQESKEENCGRRCGG